MSKQPADKESAKATTPARTRSRATVLTLQTGPEISAAELKQLMALKHPDPHRVLGAHFSPGGVVIRALRPNAQKAEVVVGRKRPLPMFQIDPRGLFQVEISALTQIPAYRFRIHYSDGTAIDLRDPYSFLPTVGELDLHLFAEGRHEGIYEKLGAHVLKLGSVSGVSFAVWAPHADGVSVVGDFNAWDGRVNQMRMLGGSGVWELFIPDLLPGALYKYEIRSQGWLPFLKTDPYARYTEIPPATSSIVFESSYKFEDHGWLKQRAGKEHHRQPLSIYEIHLGSWRRVLEEKNRPFQYRELAPVLAKYVKEMGFTHVEFLPLKEHPYGPSWGYQVSNYFAPSARYGTPDDLRYLIDHLHQQGIGVIMDWVPAHFPKDAFALGRFDGSALYEHLDPRKGEHPDWGTYIFNYGRNEVRNFLIANALYWLKEFHIDGLRVDAVASMLYLDYSRKHGEWSPNQWGGRENLEAISLLKELPFSHDEVVHMKGALLNKMPGDRWQKFANLRALYAYMWAHPGKKLLFMGGEFGQWREWSDSESLDWHLIQQPFHSGVQRLTRDLNRVYAFQNCLWEADSESVGFQWIDADNAPENIVSFIRRSPSTGRELVCIGNFSPVVRRVHRFGLPTAGPLAYSTATAASGYYNQMMNQGDVHWDRWLARKEEIRKQVARFINAEPDEIAFTTNTSTGMNVIVDALTGRGEVISCVLEFPVSTIPWMHRRIPVHFVKSVNGEVPIEEIRRAMTPKTGVLKAHAIGWMSVSDPYADRNDVIHPRHDAAARTELGCPHFAGIFALGASVDFLEQVGMAKVEERALFLNRFLTDRLLNEHWQVLSPLKGKGTRSAETLVAIDNPAEAVSRLSQLGVIVTEKPQGIRVATHFFNNKNDIDRLLGALREYRGK